MYNGSNCDRKPQLSEILTEPRKSTFVLHWTVYGNAVYVF